MRFLDFPKASPVESDGYKSLKQLGLSLHDVLRSRFLGPRWRKKDQLQFGEGTEQVFLHYLFVYLWALIRPSCTGAGRFNARVLSQVDPPVDCQDTE